MKSLSIVKYPQPILKKRATEVISISSDIHILIDQMKLTMQKNDGIGLAAPQIRRSEKIIIVQDVRDEEKAYAFLNPKIIKKSKKRSEEEEGCLSLPGIFLTIKRANEVEITAQTPEGKKIQVKAQGLAARIFQHEVDHLNGKLIIDRLSPWARFKIRKQLKKVERENTSSP